MLDELIKEFNGAIKYVPMLQDNPKWSKEECLDFAKKWHGVAIERLRAALKKEKETGISWGSHEPIWNDGIPYCRNQPTLRMMEEAAGK